MVAKLVKPGEQIIDSLTPFAVDLWHAATGICSEAGELIDAVKKLVIYNKNLNTDNVIEELGDLEFYMEQLRQRLGVTREQCLLNNINKLGARYQAHQYSDAQAHARADKKRSLGTVPCGFCSDQVDIAVAIEVDGKLMHTDCAEAVKRHAKDFNRAGVKPGIKQGS